MAVKSYAKFAFADWFGKINAGSNILFLSNNWNGQYQKGDSDSFWKTFQNINVAPCDTNFDS